MASTTTLTTLLSEFYARGYDFLNDGSTGAARATRWINQSYVDLCLRAEFAFLYTDATGTAPLTISNLGRVLSVYDATNKQSLHHLDRRTLIDSYGDLTVTGTPECFYLDSQTSLKVYPANTTASFQVRYVAKPTALASGSDIAVIPDEWIDLLVDGAVLKGQKSRDDYTQLWQIYEGEVARMVDGETVRELDGPDYVVQTEIQNY